MEIKDEVACHFSMKRNEIRFVTACFFLDIALLLFAINLIIYLHKIFH